MNLKWLVPNWMEFSKNMGLVGGLVAAYQTLAPLLAVSVPVAAPAVTAISSVVALVGVLVHAASDYALAQK